MSDQTTPKTKRAEVILGGVTEPAAIIRDFLNENAFAPGPQTVADLVGLSAAASVRMGMSRETFMTLAHDSFEAVLKYMAASGEEAPEPVTPQQSRAAMN